ncbi:uncharacterized CRM domain-containing protein At3g25440, chloroplastic isoform X1 [Oryza brachyantha]|uniref:uncharacterized CRM domain-containing protein At3g25440, chloroplastic isoform X1 n=2 Tax=Oryza brachyantha TaxID=4533 RepID=UPI000776998E|nr:uncharacterized CRM domain-containing protein At3g25440, chloroplastic isoform X1 [Oryza brachyantha]XP_015696842.1 uncharacterized CRM domain-containing protein At3g25440, chloroplastic isoform X1 [Oryza brachyantha]
MVFWRYFGNLPHSLASSCTAAAVRSHMTSLAPRLLRRRSLRSAAATVVSPSGFWARLRGAGSPCPGASSFEPTRGVSERWAGARGWWFQPVRHGSTAVTLETDGGFARFSVGSSAAKKQTAGQGQRPARAQKKMSRKAKVNQLKWYRLKAKKKMKSPNPEVRIRYKLEKAKRKEEWLIEKLRKYEVPRSPEPVHDPEILTDEEKFYLKRTGEKKKNYVPVGRRGVFGGVVLNMHLHWKKHETVKVVCKPCRPGQVYEYAEELTRLSKGTVIDIKPNNTIIFYRGKNYVQPTVMSPPDTLSKQKALEKYRYEQSLEHTSQFIEKLEKELEDYQKHVALFKNRGETSEKISSEDTIVDDLTTSSDTE